MSDTTLKGSQKATLRALGQKMGDSLRIGKDGLQAGTIREIEHIFDSRELVKLRLLSDDRVVRSKLCDEIESSTKSICVGSVGHTALFYKAFAVDSKLARIDLT